MTRGLHDWVPLTCVKFEVYFALNFVKLKTICEGDFKLIVLKEESFTESSVAYMLLSFEMCFNNAGQ